MCLAVIALNAHARFSLIIVANRDEYHDRPALPAQIWTDNPQILAGRDLRAGGTWMGLAATGKTGLLTNYREPGKQNLNAPSRGVLVSHFLTSANAAQSYAVALDTEAASFNGFNLLLADASSAHYLSNRMENKTTQLENGVHGLSNATLNIAWPKLTRTRKAVSKLLADTTQPEPNDLFDIFRDAKPAKIAELPSTGLTPERELQLSSPFILDNLYGTRCSTVIMADRFGQTYFEERSFNQQGEIIHVAKWHLDTLSQKFTPLT